MKKYIISTFAAVALVFSFVPATVGADSLFSPAKEDACIGAELDGGKKDCDPDASKNVDSLIETIVNLLSIIVGVIAVIMIIVNGLRFVTSGGDPNSVTSARNGVIYAFVGLVLVALAQFIVKFVLTRTS